jgi:hypothetical protein
MEGNAISVRINGVLPDVRATDENTSISVFYGDYHLLIDAGGGVADSVRKGASENGHGDPSAILVTHGQHEHVSDLASFSAKIYCTSECADQIARELPQVDRSRFVPVVSGQQFEAGPFSIVPVGADNAGDSPGLPGSVIYIIQSAGKKVVAGWDFLKLTDADQKLLWNPDLAIFGAETYNEHPSTGMISVSQVYDLARRWNAKDCYVLHYSGEKDREDAKNQWHRGPEGPLPLEELQRVIDDHLRVSGQEGKFSIKVARQGAVWRPPVAAEDGGPVGSKIEVEALERYVFGLEKIDKSKMVFSVEDSVNRLTSEFVNPKAGDEGSSLHADPLKGMMMKGPELNLVISGATVKVDVVKGKKPVFAAEMSVSERDAKKLTRYIRENFA